MRLCHITTVHVFNDTRIYRRECESLVNAGHEVYLIAPCNGQAESDNGVEVVPVKPIRSKLMRMFFMPFRAVRAALKTKADIYHYHDPEFVVMGFILRWVLGKKVVFDIHESVARQILAKAWIPKPLRRPMSLIYSLIEKLFLAGQSIVVANERSVNDYKGKVYLVQNYPIQREDIISSYDPGKFDQKPCLVYVGGVSRVRGADIYVELAGKLVESGYDFEMKIIGPPSPASLLEELRERSKELNIEGKIEFTGRLDWVDAMNIVSRAQIGLCLLRPIPNYTTCLATKIIEYMMLGIPNLSSKFDVWRPYVEGEGTGLMADPEDIEEVVDTCKRLLGDKKQLLQMAEKGIKAVKEKYNWKNEFKVLLECYSKLCESAD